MISEIKKGHGQIAFFPKRLPTSSINCTKTGLSVRKIVPSLRALLVASPAVKSWSYDGAGWAFVINVRFLYDWRFPQFGSVHSWFCTAQAGQKPVRLAGAIRRYRKDVLLMRNPTKTVTLNHSRHLRKWKWVPPFCNRLVKAAEIGLWEFATFCSMLRMTFLFSTHLTKIIWSASRQG